MESVQEDVLALQVQSVKDLYLEFFLLLDQSVREDPLTQPAGGLDRTIEQMMAMIDQQMKDFRRDVARAEGQGGLGASLKATILEFDGQLREGLEIMSDRVARRTVELAQARDQMKERLILVQRKRQGAKGYRPHKSTSTLLKSQV